MAAVIVCGLTACTSTDDAATLPSPLSSNGPSEKMSPEPPEQAQTNATEPIDGTREPRCATLARYDILSYKEGEWVWAISGHAVDSGPAGGACGTADPELSTYTVAPGDTLIGIGERFCVDYIHLMMINRLEDPGGLQAGQTIRLVPVGDAAEYVASPPE